MRVLILVDLQNDFMPGGPLGVADGDATIAVANRLMPSFDLVVATQDYHPEDHGSFVTRHPGAKVGDQIRMGGLDQTVWPVHCVQGTRGAAFHDDLERDGIARVFPKGTDAGIDSYSGFFDNGKLRATGLGDHLVERGVTSIYVMGLATDYCVKATAIDAAQLGFRTHVITDGCRAVNLQPGDGERAIEDMHAAGVVPLTSQEIEALRDAAGARGTNR